MFTIYIFVIIFYKNINRSFYYKNKQTYLMIFLVSFNFYACTNQSVVNPINTLIEKKNHNDGRNNNIYIEVGADTMINANAASSFRLILKP